MKISCSECRSQLGEVLNGEVTGDLGAAAEARDHLVDCTECQRELALMRAARDEMRSFTEVIGAPDLRGRIRAHLAATPLSTPFVAGASMDKPTQLATEPMNALSPDTSALIVAAPRRKDEFVAAESSSEKMSSAALEKNALEAAKAEKAVFQKAFAPEKTRHMRSPLAQLIEFLQRPSNMAWTSGVALAVFCLVMVANPHRQTRFLEPPYSISEDEQEYYGQPSKESAASKAAQSPRVSANAKNKTAQAAKVNPNARVVPGQKPVPLLPPQLGAGGIFSSNGDATDALPQAAPPRSSQQGAATSVQKNAGFADEAKTERSRNAKSEDNASRIPQAASSASPTDTPSTQLAEIPSAALKRESDSPRALPSVPPANPRQPANNNAGTFAMRAAPTDGVLSDADGATAASIKSKSSDRQMESTSADSADIRKPHATTRAPAPRRNAVISRRVVASIAAPRDMNWGQVSVVLPDGVRFSDGSRAKVLWRGAVGAGENVAVRFNVQADEGSHAIRVSLQEVVKGQAQTLASDSVSVSGR